MGVMMAASPEERAAARLLVQSRQPSPEILAYRRELERLGDAVVKSDNGYGFSAWLAAGCPTEGETLEVGKPMSVRRVAISQKVTSPKLARDDAVLNFSP